MATIFLFLLLSAIFTAKAQSGQSSIEQGSFLTVTTTTNSSWLSPSGLYAFGFYKQGNGYAVGIFVEGIPQKTVVWTANRDDPPVPADAILNFTSDGQLVLQSAQQGTKRSIANPPGVATSASMLDSGNFVLYNSDNSTIWQSFEQPTDTLLPSQQLLVQKVLNSSVSDSNHSTGRFLLLMQLDGYLAMYPVGTPWSVIWSKPDDKCRPKGLCGLNAYCVKTNQSFGCNCLPGFAPTNQSEKSSGCDRNFTADSCKESMSYTMELVSNTKWEAKNISVLSLTQEACKAACLDDC